METIPEKPTGNATSLKRKNSIFGSPPQRKKNFFHSILDKFSGKDKEKERDREILKMTIKPPFM